MNKVMKAEKSDYDVMKNRLSDLKLKKNLTSQNFKDILETPRHLQYNNRVNLTSRPCSNSLSKYKKIIGKPTKINSFNLLALEYSYNQKNKLKNFPYQNNLTKIMKKKSFNDKSNYNYNSLNEKIINENIYMNKTAVKNKIKIDNLLTNPIKYELIKKNKSNLSDNFNKRNIFNTNINKYISPRLTPEIKKAKSIIKSKVSNEKTNSNMCASPSTANNSNTKVNNSSSHYFRKFHISPKNLKNKLNSVNFNNNIQNNYDNYLLDNEQDNFIKMTTGEYQLIQLLAKKRNKYKNYIGKINRINKYYNYSNKNNNENFNIEELYLKYMNHINQRESNSHNEYTNYINKGDNNIYNYINSEENLIKINNNYTHSNTSGSDDLNYRLWLSKNYKNDDNKNNIKNEKEMNLNPIIRYSFLEKIINNINRKINLVNQNSEKEFELNIKKAINEELNSLLNNYGIKDEKLQKQINKDFITYGYELNPEILNKIKELKEKKDNEEKEKEKDKNIKRPNSTIFISQKKSTTLYKNKCINDKNLEDSKIINKEKIKSILTGSKINDNNKKYILIDNNISNVKKRNEHRLKYNLSSCNTNPNPSYREFLEVFGESSNRNKLDWNLISESDKEKGRILWNKLTRVTPKKKTYNKLEKNIINKYSEKKIINNNNIKNDNIINNINNNNKKNKFILKRMNSFVPKNTSQLINLGLIKDDNNDDYNDKDDDKNKLIEKPESNNNDIIRPRRLSSEKKDLLTNIIKYEKEKGFNKKNIFNNSSITENDNSEEEESELESKSEEKKKVENNIQKEEKEKYQKYQKIQKEEKSQNIQKIQIKEKGHKGQTSQNLQRIQIEEIEKEQKIQKEENEEEEKEEKITIEENNIEKGKKEENEKKEIKKIFQNINNKNNDKNIEINTNNNMGRRLSRKSIKRISIPNVTNIRKNSIVLQTKNQNRNKNKKNLDLLGLSDYAYNLSSSKENHKDINNTNSTNKHKYNYKYNYNYNKLKKKYKIKKNKKLFIEKLSKNYIYKDNSIFPEDNSILNNLIPDEYKDKNISICLKEERECLSDDNNNNKRIIKLRKQVLEFSIIPSKGKQMIDNIFNKYKKKYKKKYKEDYKMDNYYDYLYNKYGEQDDDSFTVKVNIYGLELMISPNIQKNYYKKFMENIKKQNKLKREQKNMNRRLSMILDKYSLKNIDKKVRNKKNKSKTIINKIIIKSDKLYQKENKSEQNSETKRQLETNFKDEIKNLELIWETKDDSLRELQKKKEEILYKLKNDIKYKIKEGVVNQSKMENFNEFQRRINQLALEGINNKIYLKKLEQGINSFEEDLKEDEEKRKNERRINGFIDSMNYDFNFFDKIKEKYYCHAIDFKLKYFVNILSPVKSEGNRKRKNINKI